MAGKIRTDIAYVHSTTKNVNPLYNWNQVETQYGHYLALFNKFYSDLKSEHDRILGYYENEKALKDDLNLEMRPDVYPISLLK